MQTKTYIIHWQVLTIEIELCIETRSHFSKILKRIDKLYMHNIRNIQEKARAKNNRIQSLLLHLIFETSKTLSQTNQVKIQIILIFLFLFINKAKWDLKSFKFNAWWTIFGQICVYYIFLNELKWENGECHSKLFILKVVYLLQFSQWKF